jgi:hypothetical protein
MTQLRLLVGRTRHRGDERADGLCVSRVACVARGNFAQMRNLRNSLHARSPKVSSTVGLTVVTAPAVATSDFIINSGGTYCLVE